MSVVKVLTYSDGRSAPATIVERGPPTDLANALFGKARVRCWTTPRDRRWGKHDGELAAVMHFRMQASGPEDCRMNDFELDLKFSISSECDHGVTIDSLAEMESLSGMTTGNTDIYLIELPAPSCVLGEPILHEYGERLSHGTDANVGESTSPGAVASLLRCWTLRSDSITDEKTGQCSAARWTWEANGDQMRTNGKILHGGLAIRHPGQQIGVVCQVRGRVLKRGGIRLKFSNEHHTPRLWNLIPQQCETDLQSLIDQLEAEMIRLNKSKIGESTLSGSSPALAPAAAVRRSYGPSNIAGSGSVHMGDTILNMTFGQPSGVPPQ